MSSAGVCNESVVDCPSSVSPPGCHLPQGGRFWAVRYQAQSRYVKNIPVSVTNCPSGLPDKNPQPTGWGLIVYLCTSLPSTIKMRKIHARVRNALPVGVSRQKPPAKRLGVNCLLVHLVTEHNQDTQNTCLCP